MEVQYQKLLIAHMSTGMFPSYQTLFNENKIIIHTGPNKILMISAIYKISRKL